MPQDVAASRLGDLRSLDELADHAAEDVGVEGLAVAGDEEGAFVGIEEELGAGFIEVAFQPLEGAGAYWNDAVFVAFALPDLEGLAVAVEVVELQFCEFAAPHAGAVEEFEDGAVPEAERVGGVGDVEELFHLLEAEGFLWKSFLGTGHFKLAGGVGREVVLFDQVREEVFDRSQAAALGADSERLAVGLAPPPEVALVAFEDGLGDGAGVVQVAVGGPVEEDF